jgi:hypothetical protein
MTTGYPDRVGIEASTTLLILVALFLPTLFAIDFTSMSTWWVARLPQPKPWQPR